jgi:subtilisin family serine protease
LGSNQRHAVDHFDVDGDGFVENVDLVRAVGAYAGRPLLARWTKEREKIFGAVANQLIVRLTKGVPKKDAVSMLQAALCDRPHLRDRIMIRGNTKDLLLVELRSTPGDLEKSTDEVPYLLTALPRLKGNAYFEASPNYLVFAPEDIVGSATSIAAGPKQDDILRIGGKAAWGEGGSTDIRVAILDSGIEATHPDLAGNIYSDSSGAIIGANFSQSGSLNDDSYHGTFCAGIIGGTGVKHVNGVCLQVSLMPIKFLGPDSCGSIYDAMRGIDYAVANDAHVICASWGGMPFDKNMRDKISQAKNSLFVTGSGNFTHNLDTDPPYYPASFGLPNMITVGGTDNHGNPITCWGVGEKSVHLLAPGESVYSTLPPPLLWGRDKGTSLSAAFVAGACALLGAVALKGGRQWDPAWVKSTLLQRVLPLGSAKLLCVSGGELNLAELIKLPLP